MISNFFLYGRRYLGDDKVLQIAYEENKLSFTFCIKKYARSYPQKAY